MTAVSDNEVERKENRIRLWRMTHYRNIRFILRKGLHCGNCEPHDPDYINIGHRRLVGNRGISPVKISPGGVLNDYIPFYFHYQMPMLHNIYNGKVQDYEGTQEEIIYLVSSVEKVREIGAEFVFTDRHAYLDHKAVYNNYEELQRLDWNIIKDNDWYKEYSDIRKELKQAEFLIYRHFPVNGILGIVAHNQAIAEVVQTEIALAGLSIKVVVRPNFYFP